MTKPVSRRMAVDCLLYTIIGTFGMPLICVECDDPLLPGQIMQFDHTWAIVHGGPHGYKDIRLIHYDPCHKRKTKKDVQANYKVKRIQAGGRKRKGQKIKSRPFPSKPKVRSNG